MSSPASPPQKIIPIRRDYNTWVANETLEDYALRFTPHAFRKWGEGRVANTALGATSFLALEAIGGTIAVNYGFTSALWAILVVGLLTFLTALPISVHAARHGVDMDLLTRGAGFGYLGSTITSLIYATFTFIFFALEAAIMALALEMALDWPLVWCHVASSLVIVPLATHGITLISRLQAWTQPLWVVLLVFPFVWLAFSRPDLYHDFVTLTGRNSGDSGFDWLTFGAAAAVPAALIVQVGEQVDFLRFLPPCTPASRTRWWAAVLMAGPGWIVPGMLKMLGGAFLAFVALQGEIPADKAVEPTQMYLAAFREALGDPGWALAVTVLFVIVSQVKINVTNAYAGSLAWSNFFARLTHSHPGRVLWLLFNVVIALLLMTLGVFGAIERVLGLYGNVAVAWVGAIVADLVINKPLGWSPKGIVFQRAYLYDLNPVGLGAMLAATVLSVAAYAGLLGPWPEACSPLIALATAMTVSPLLAWATGGRWYLARRPEDGPVGAAVAGLEGARGEDGRYRRLTRCCICEREYEAPDMAGCPAYGAPICSLCCTLESRCQDRCKSRSRAAEQLHDALLAVLPRRWAPHVNFGLGHWLVVFTAICLVLVFALGVVWAQESLTLPAGTLTVAFVKVFALLALVAAVCAWWVVLASESRRMAYEESARQTQLLQREIDAHRRTDAALQGAKELAEAASRAKTRYVAGMTHELRTPLNSILGYTQILLRRGDLPPPVREAVATVHHSGEHMHALIDGLLDLARIEAGRLKLDPAPLPLPAFIDDLVRMVRPQAQARQLDFRLETSGRVPEWVNADAKRLRQILINLLANAVRFTDRGHVTLRVDCSRHVVRFEVEDSGIGIAPQDQERIFHPFERGSAGRRAREAGTGLGLTITHLLTELMGGELSLVSEVDVGSTFTVRLYLREIELPAPASVQGLAPGELLRPVTGHAGPPRTLLVVDDQPMHRQMLAGLLAPLGFVIVEAASGRECLEVVSRARPDAVLLDLSMDDLDGWETARRLRAGGETALPVVFVSANLFENQPARLAEVGAQGFVGKPVRESELLEVLGRVLGLRWTREAAPVPEATGWSLPRPAAGFPAADLPPGPLAGTPPGPSPAAQGGTAPAPGHPEAPPPLPAGLRADLLRLARMGHLQGLRGRLAAAEAEHPALDSEWRRLRLAVDRLDLGAVARRLERAAALPDPDQAEADEPDLHLPPGSHDR